ncbi:ASC1-like protein 3 [Acorus gramineus]|uniref:ASC1-like protein 3 n=1 Tax=Acorus gramineus TaxID=55184 RepID=A0AAV9AG66_ACOGR|nr:ASC1-like protein 3 [Acorus gramineus]
MDGSTLSTGTSGGGVAPPAPRDFSLAIYFAVAFIAARFVLDAFVYQRLAIKILSNGAVSVRIGEAKQAKIIKFSESMWKATYYITIQLWVLAIIVQEPWSRDTKEYFKGWPNQDLKHSVKLFYMCQCGFYIYSIAALLTWETRRKDFAIMMSHHIITTILMGYSYVTGQLKNRGKVGEDIRSDSEDEANESVHES